MQEDKGVEVHCPYRLYVRYANDGGSDSVSIMVDNEEIGSFDSTDTFAGGERGDGRYNYRSSPWFNFETGESQIASIIVRVNSGDEYGFRLGAIRVTKGSH